MPAAAMMDLKPPTSPSASHRRASLKVLSRNIDKVALGNMVFPTWYYSPYPDNIIHDLDSNTITVKAEPSTHAGLGLKYDSKPIQSHRGSVNGISKHHAPESGLHQTHMTIPNEKALLNILHVCPYCFRYTYSSVDFAHHLALHIKPESDYYTKLSNSKHKRKPRPRRSASTPPSMRHHNDEDDAPRPVPDSAIKVYSHNGYTVWDVDGETEKLYCQNLSLFGKLFLEQKSVFFDTAGFHYFILTYCPPPEPTSLPNDSAQHTNNLNQKSGSSTGARTNRDSKTGRDSTSPTSTRKRRKSNPIATTDAAEGITGGNNPSLPTTNPTSEPPPTLNRPSFPLRHQVLGFFSKENLSWDSNNLACILVFPPYQHRNLGQLLMAVSYKLSGWEWEDSIIGGPEKPLSAMGRKSYLRFWSERIARFVMGQSQDAEGLRVFEEGVMQETETEDGELQQVMTGKKRKRKHGRGFLKDELSIKELGDRTGMLGEDVVAALVEMGVCDMVPPSSKKKPAKQLQNNTDGAGADTAGGNANTTTVGNAGSKSMATNDIGSTGTDQNAMSVTVSRSKVLDWAKKHGVDMISSVREEGFLGEWALSESGSEEDGDGDASDDGDGDEA